MPIMVFFGRTSEWQLWAGAQQLSVPRSWPIHTALPWRPAINMNPPQRSIVMALTRFLQRYDLPRNKKSRFGSYPQPRKLSTVTCILLHSRDIFAPETEISLSQNLLLFFAFSHWILWRIFVAEVKKFLGNKNIVIYVKKRLYYIWLVKQKKK